VVRRRSSLRDAHDGGGVGLLVFVSCYCRWKGSSEPSCDFQDFARGPWCLFTSASRRNAKPRSTRPLSLPVNVVVFIKVLNKG
jgi:hypothetical protein